MVQHVSAMMVSLQQMSWSQEVGEQACTPQGEVQILGYNPVYCCLLQASLPHDCSKCDGFVCVNQVLTAWMLPGVLADLHL